MPRYRALVLVLSIVVVAAVAAGAADYELHTNRKVAEVVPPELAKGPHYTVRDPVVTDGYMYHFQVDSDFGPFEAAGIGALRKLAREIWAIGELKQITGSEVFLKALKEQATKPLTFAKNIITKPGDTLSGVPKGVGRLFSNASTAATNTLDPSQESRTKEVLQVGAFKREYAGRYDVDPYSSNKVLQEELDKIGKAGAYGLWTASLGTAPISGTAGAVMSVTALSQSFNNLLKNEPPARIRSINEEKLKEIGVSSDLAKRYLDHTAYTPRHDVILVDSLARIAGATGRDAYVNASLAAADEVEANFFVNTAQIMRGYHEMQGPITMITMIEALTVAQTRSGAALIPFALDYGMWTANADKLSQHLKKTYSPAGFNGKFELWVTGTLSPTAKQELQARGFTVVENAGSRFDIVD